MMALVVASVSLVAWLYLLMGRGGFWRAVPRDDVGVTKASEWSDWPRVTAVIPARNEAELIGENIRSLLRQDYRGEFSLIVVDDHSSDDTAAIVRRVASAAPGRVTVLAAPTLPEGWTGKLWALNHGIRYAESLPEPPDYVLPTDADIRHATDSLTSLVTRARRNSLVLTSLMARLRCETLAERALIPAFVFFFQMLYPFTWVNRIERKTAAAAGGCMLVHRRALSSGGGIDAIRGEIIDDCALAQLLKRQGPIWIGLSERVYCTRSCRSINAIRRMIVRSAFAQLRFSSWWLACAIAAMSIVFVAPALVVIFGEGVARVLAALAWACMAVAFQPMLRFYGVSPWWGLALPAIAAVYVIFTLDSAFQHLRGRGGEWKGRVRARASGT